MKHKKRSVLLSAALLTAVPMGAAATLYERVFSRRGDPLERQITQTADELLLSARPVSFPSGENTLRGFVYADRSGPDLPVKGLVLCSHGIFADHTVLLPVIARFCRAGYRVMAFDDTGCGQSVGKNIRGLCQAADDLNAALRFIRRNADLRDLPLVLFGHSLGAYAVCACLPFAPHARAAAVFSPFNRSDQMLLAAGRQLIGKKVWPLSPYIRAYEHFKFGNTARLTAVDGINAVSVPVWLFHAEDDQIVPLTCSPAARPDALTNKNAACFLYDHRGHYVFQSDRALAYQKSLGRGKQLFDQSGIPNDYNGVPVDAARFCELDEALLGRVIGLYDSVCTRS